MQQLIINRKQFPPQAEHRAKDWGPATTKRHEWVTGCSQRTYTCARETTNPTGLTVTQSFSSFLSSLSLFVLGRSAHAVHCAHDRVACIHLVWGTDNSLQSSCLCFKVISDLSIWDSTPQAAPAEGSWAKQWPFHGEYDSYILSFIRQHAANCIWYHVVFARITVIA